MLFRYNSTDRTVTAVFKKSASNYTIKLGVSASPYTNEYGGKAFRIFAWVATNSGYSWTATDRIRCRIKYNNTDYCEVIIQDDNAEYSTIVDSNNSTNIELTNVIITSASWISGSHPNVTIKY